MPVFCCDCRFFLDATRPTQRRCLHPHARYWVDTSVECQQRWRTPTERNAHHDCRDFRPVCLWERLIRIDPTYLMVGGLLLAVLVGVWWFYSSGGLHGSLRAF